MTKENIALGIAILALIVGGLGLVGGDQSVGGSTRFPNSDLSAATITSSGAFTSTGAATFSSTITGSGDVTIDSGDLFVDVSTNRVGIGSSTPTSILSVGTTAATSTITGGNFCSYFEDEAGRGMWITLAISGSSVFSTSTTACNI